MNNEYAAGVEGGEVRATGNKPAMFSLCSSLALTWK
jgi:hypothetical protein